MLKKCADIDTVPQDYGIYRWGEGYFAINSLGHIAVRPSRQRSQQIDLYHLAAEVQAAGLALPVLIRFTDILHDRVSTLCNTFHSVSRELGYHGGYKVVYPIKVNQQRSVIEEILSRGNCVGLEVGSKPELMAVLAHSNPGGTIVCNGYKDREYIRLALIGTRLGYRVYLVIDKSSELGLVLREAADLGIEPLLGVRVRLASSASGNWQDSGGDRSKFGLNAEQLLELVDSLKAAGKLHYLQLLHSHIGSQIPCLLDIRRCMGEAARYYSELRGLDVDIQVVDVGGGLGVDYEGTGTRHECSANYTQAAYAREVVKALSRICGERNLPHPEIFSESGRAITAHHAMLMFNIIDSDSPPQPLDSVELPGGAPEVLQTLARELEQVGQRSATEVYHEALNAFEEARELFLQGDFSLRERALAERIFYSVCHRLKPLLNAGSKRHRELLETLRERLADRLFGNFSLFQSLPDVWAIDQIFPVVPLHRLLEPPQRSAILHDLTCDSDGCINRYVDRDGVESSLPVHEFTAGENYLLGIFLVGAYQEILGDMHNLFGDTNAVNLELDGEGGYRLTQHEQGDSVDELLRIVHFTPEVMLGRYRKMLSDQVLDPLQAEALFSELEAGLHGYTYFED